MEGTGVSGPGPDAVGLIELVDRLGKTNEEDRPLESGRFFVYSAESHHSDDLGGLPNA